MQSQIACQSRSYWFNSITWLDSDRWSLATRTPYPAGVVDPVLTNQVVPLAQPDTVQAWRTAACATLERPTVKGSFAWMKSWMSKT